MPDILNIFIEKFSQIKAMGWIKSHRTGTTGIGKTFEDLLGVQENNLQAPDIGEYEIKCTRASSNSMLTIVTKSPDTAGANKLLLDKYGYTNEQLYGNSDKILHATLWADSLTKIDGTGHSLGITIIDDKIYIIDESGPTDVYWSANKIKDCIEHKYRSKKLIYVKADNRKIPGEGEEFRFESAILVEGIEAEKILALIDSNALCIDLRVGQYHDGPNKGKVHDHGTGIRIKEKDQPLLFSKTTLLG